MCACLLRHPKKSNVFRKIRVTPLRYVFTANDNHSKKRFFFGVAKSSPTSVLQLRFFFVLQSSLKSDFIWSLLLVCRVEKKMPHKNEKENFVPIPSDLMVIYFFLIQILMLPSFEFDKCYLT